MLEVLLGYSKTPIDERETEISSFLSSYLVQMSVKDFSASLRNIHSEKGANKAYKNAVHDWLFLQLQRGAVAPHL